MGIRMKLTGWKVFINLISMAKELKKWNGRAYWGNEGTYYVAAYSKIEAARLIARASKAQHVSLHEINAYYSPTWGTPMDGIVPTEPCVYHQKSISGKPKRIL